MPWTTQGISEVHTAASQVEPGAVIAASEMNLALPVTLSKTECLFLLPTSVVSAPWISCHCCCICSSEWGSSRAAWICLCLWLYLWLQWDLLLWGVHSLLQRCGISPRKQGQKREKIYYDTVWQLLPCTSAKCHVRQISLLTLSSPFLSVWWQQKCLLSERPPPLIFKLWWFL